MTDPWYGLDETGLPKHYLPLGLTVILGGAAADTCTLANALALAFGMSRWSIGPFTPCAEVIYLILDEGSPISVTEHIDDVIHVRQPPTFDWPMVEQALNDLVPDVDKDCVVIIQNIHKLSGTHEYNEVRAWSHAHRMPVIGVA